MKDAKKTLSFVIHPEGYITLDNFRPRTLYEALYVFLEKDWDRSPEALSQSMTRSADLLTLVLSVRDGLERGLMQDTEKARKEFEKVSLMETSSIEGKAKTAIETLNYVGFFSGWMSIRTVPIKAWVEQLSDDVFSELIAALKKSLDENVTIFHDVFSASQDSATGVAVHIMRGLSLIHQEELKLKYLSDVGPYEHSAELMKVFERVHTPDFVATTLTAAKANKVAKKLNLPITFRKANTTKKTTKAKNAHAK